MQLRPTLIALALIAHVMNATGCASDDSAHKGDKQAVGKHRFTAADYNLDFLEVDKTAERLSPMVVDKIRAVLDHIERKLPALLAAIPQPAPQLIQLAVAKGKPVLATHLETKLTALITEHRADVDPIVRKYDVFKDPELSFDLIEDDSADLKDTVDRVNRTLKDAYRTARAIRVSRKMIAIAHTDAASLKTTPSPAALAGVGVAALSITEMSLEAVEDSQQLLPELKQLTQDLTNQLAANPLLAVSYSRMIGAVAGATADLTTVPKDAADLLTEASDLLTLFDG